MSSITHKGRGIPLSALA